MRLLVARLSAAVTSAAPTVAAEAAPTVAAEAAVAREPTMSGEARMSVREAVAPRTLMRMIPVVMVPVAQVAPAVVPRTGVSVGVTASRVPDRLRARGKAERDGG